MKSWQPLMAGKLWKSLRLSDVLDLMLPEIGLRVIFARPAMCRSLSHFAKDTEFDKVIWLENCADDYNQTLLNRELQARVRPCCVVRSLRPILAWKWGRYGNCNWWSSHPSRRFLGSKVQQRIGSIGREFELLYHPYSMSVKSWPVSTFETVWLRLLWWCSTWMTVRRLRENRGHTGASRIYLDPPWYDIIWETMITQCNLSCRVELCLVLITVNIVVALLLLENRDNNAPNN